MSKKYILVYVLMLFLVFLFFQYYKQLNNKITSLELELSISNKKIEEQKALIANKEEKLYKLQSEIDAFNNEIDSSLLQGNIDYCKGALFWGADFFILIIVKSCFKRYYLMVIIGGQKALN